jgi:hypothetical protein
MHLPTIEESLRAVVEHLRSGAFTRREIANEAQRCADAVGRDSNATAGAKTQLRILADMLDDGAMPIDEARAKYIAGEIRKCLEWIK